VAEDRIHVRPLSAALGAEIGGVDVTRLDDDGLARVKAAWLEHLVLLFRGQRLSDGELVAFSRRFGPLDVAPPNENGVRSAPGFPEILVISNVVEDGVEIGSLGNAEAAWHTDMSYIETPPTGSLLYALEVPPAGGDTGFLNMYRALDELPGELRRRVEGKHIKHDATTNSAGYLRAGVERPDDLQVSPGVCHPIVRRHPETGRQALYLGRRHLASIPGLEPEGSEHLLDALWAHTTQTRFTWHHQWRAGDLLIWDNRAAMHRRDPFDAKARRIMHRTQIAGDRPV